jgi:hypothetical protein
MCYFIRTSSIDKGNGETLQVWKFIHMVDLIQKELLPQENDSKRLARIHLEVLIPML